MIKIGSLIPFITMRINSLSTLILIPKILAILVVPGLAKGNNNAAAAATKTITEILTVTYIPTTTLIPISTITELSTGNIVPNTPKEVEEFQPTPNELNVPLVTPKPAREYQY